MVDNNGLKREIATRFNIYHVLYEGVRQFQDYENWQIIAESPEDGDGIIYNIKKSGDKGGFGGANGIGNPLKIHITDTHMRLLLINYPGLRFRTS